MKFLITAPISIVSQVSTDAILHPASYTKDYIG
jgi:hypothetical protein